MLRKKSGLLDFWNLIQQRKSSSEAYRSTVLSHYLSLPVTAINQDEAVRQGRVGHQDLVQLVIHYLPRHLQKFAREKVSFVSLEKAHAALTEHNDYAETGLSAEHADRIETCIVTRQFYECRKQHLTFLKLLFISLLLTMWQTHQAQHHSGN